MSVALAVAVQRAAVAADQAGQPLQRLVYLGVYAGPEPASSRPRAPATSVAAEDRAFVDRMTRLVDAHVVHVADVVVARTDDGVVLLCDGVRIRVSCRDLLGPATTTSGLRFRLPALRPGVSPGFVHRTGGLDRASLVTRIYVNVRPPDAWVILGPVFEALVAAGIECDAKVLAHPSNYFRADSAVIYVPSEAELRSLRIVQRVLGDHDVRLDEHTPALTKRIARGIAVADEPSDLAGMGEMSHGQWVTGILVEAVEGSYEVEKIATRIEQLIIRDGRDPERPYRRGGAFTQPIG